MLEDLAPDFLGRAPRVVVLEALVGVGVLADDLARLGDAGHAPRQPRGAGAARGVTSRLFSAMLIARYGRLALRELRQQHWGEVTLFSDT